MTRPDLYRAMADAEERNPDGEWWKEFDIYCIKGWIKADDPMHLNGWVTSEPGQVRLAPRTYTLHIEDMPEPMREFPEWKTDYWFVDLLIMEVVETCWTGSTSDRRRFENGNCFDMEDKAEIVLHKLTEAMGVKGHD